MKIFPYIANKTRKRIGLLTALGLLFGVCTPFFVHADFLQNLKDMNVPVTDIQDKKGISRYDLAKLLNASECKDCIAPAQKMVNTYNLSFRSTFTTQQGNYFGDIDYVGGLYNSQSYYYCVAYVGDNGYMNGYPASTSPICAGKFCGASITTKAEFIQVIINLLAKYIYSNIQINRQQVQTWLEKLKTSSYEYKTFTSDDIKLIKANAKACTTEPCYLSKAQDIQPYLKYCMFNLQVCGMQSLGKLKQGYRPVAEVNLLLSQNILAVNQTDRSDTSNPVDGKTVIAILSRINNRIQCTFNDDYDCDSITNTQDNCPNAYNPNQTDTDQDKRGDVCSPDSDGDGVANPIGIVDDNGHVNIQSLQGRSGTLDNCLLVSNSDQLDSNHNKIGEACENPDTLGIYITTPALGGSAPISVTLDAVTKGSVKKIIWDFGDGSTDEGMQVQHIFLLPGIYRVQATAQGNTENAKAQLIFKIGGITDQQTALQAKSSSIGSYHTAEFTLGASSIGGIDRIDRTFDGGSKSTKTANQTISKILNTTGTHQVIMKAYTQQNLVAVSIFNIGMAAPGTILKSDMINPEINQKTSFTTQTFGFTTTDISYITRDYGDGKTENNTSLHTIHTYTQAGKKAVVQTIYLLNGQQIHNIITLYIQDKTLLRSYGILMVPDTLIGNVGNKVKFSSYAVGDTRQTPTMFLSKFDAATTQTQVGTTKLPLITTHSYFKLGKYLPEINVFINQCTYLKAQATIAVSGPDICLQAQLDGTLHQKFRCDMDKDTIPDLCDNDIDGDGIANLLGLITQENKDCSLHVNNNNGASDATNISSANNVNLEFLHMQFKDICSLDNAPFTPNNNQSDLNRDGIGDAGASGSIDSGLLFLVSDSDGDGVSNNQDLCLDINGMGTENGCPIIEGENNCNQGNNNGIINGTNNGSSNWGNTGINSQITATELPVIVAVNCNQCPCQYTDFIASLTNGDQVQAILRNTQKTILYNYSLPRIVNF